MSAELRSTFDNCDGTATYRGEEVFVRGIRGRLLGIGTFAGSLILAEADGNEAQYPIMDVQGQFVSGGQVDLWSTDPALIDEHRTAETYPIGLYLAEVRTIDERNARLMDKAYAKVLGVTLD